MYFVNKNDYYTLDELASRLMEASIDLVKLFDASVITPVVIDHIQCWPKAEVEKAIELCVKNESTVRVIK